MVLVCLLKEFLLLEHSQWLKASLQVLGAMHLFYVGLPALITWYLVVVIAKGDKFEIVA